MPRGDLARSPPTPAPVDKTVDLLHVEATHLERRPPEMRGLDVEQINRLVYRRWRRRRPSEVAAWHRRVHADVLRTLAMTPREWFARGERSPQWPADFDGHSAAHRVRDIE